MTGDGREAGRTRFGAFLASLRADDGDDDPESSEADAADVGGPAEGTAADEGRSGTDEPGGETAEDETTEDPWEWVGDAADGEAAASGGDDDEPGDDGHDADRDAGTGENAPAVPIRDAEADATGEDGPDDDAPTGDGETVAGAEPATEREAGGDGSGRRRIWHRYGDGRSRGEDDAPVAENDAPVAGADVAGAPDWNEAVPSPESSEPESGAGGSTEGRDAVRGPGSVVSTPDSGGDEDTTGLDRSAALAGAAQGAQLLVLSPEGDPVSDRACSHVLTAGEGPRNVAIVTVGSSSEQRVRVCRADGWPGGEISVVEVGGDGGSSRSEVVGAGGDAVVTRRVSSPRNLSRLGIMISRVLADWDDDRPRKLCLYTLTDYLEYVDVRTLFQFLVTLTSHLSSSGVDGHYHLDPTAHDAQTVRTLESVFDVVVWIGEDGSVEIDPNAV